MQRKEIARRLECLAKMIRDGDETTTEIAEAREALDAISEMENFKDATGLDAY